MRRLSYYVPKLSLTLHIVGIVLICLLTWIVIALKLHKSTGVETIINGSILFVVLCTYFIVILYHGFRFDNGIVKWRKPKIELHNVSDAFSNVPDVSLFDFSFDDGFGCLGFIVGLLGVVLSVAMAVVLLYLGMEITLIIGLCIIVPLYWLFRLSARIVLANTRLCKNNISISILIGIKYAFIYSVFISFVFFGIEKLLLKIV